MRCNLWLIKRVWAVSYTHLDVYKRQQHHIPLYVYGGGSSVTRGVEPIKGGISLDMRKRFNKIISFNEEMCIRDSSCIGVNRKMRKYFWMTGAATHGGCSPPPQASPAVSPSGRKAAPPWWEDGSGLCCEMCIRDRDRYEQ